MCAITQYIIYLIQLRGLINCIAEEVFKHQASFDQGCNLKNWKILKTRFCPHQLFKFWIHFLYRVAKVSLNQEARTLQHQVLNKETCGYV